jgi:hypothetical protein
MATAHLSYTLQEVATDGSLLTMRTRLAYCPRRVGRWGLYWLVRELPVLEALNTLVLKSLR